MTRKAVLTTLFGWSRCNYLQGSCKAAVSSLGWMMTCDGWFW